MVCVERVERGIDGMVLIKVLPARMVLGMVDGVLDMAIIGCLQHLGIPSAM